MNFASATNNASKAGETLYTALKQFMRSERLDFDVILPAIVTSVTSGKSGVRVSVLPAIKHVLTDKTDFSRRIIVDLPMVTMGAGGFVISFPVKIGDKGWILACDRDIAAFKATLKESAPLVYRAHSFADAFFLPDIMGAFTPASGAADGMTIQSIDGATSLVIKQGEIDITTKKVMITASDGVNITGDVQVDGNITAAKDVKAGAISLSNHIHGGVQSGGSNTSPPK